MDEIEANFFGYYIKRINWKSNKKREYSMNNEIIIIMKRNFERIKEKKKRIIKYKILTLNV